MSDESTGHWCIFYKLNEMKTLAAYTNATFLQVRRGQNSQVNTLAHRLRIYWWNWLNFCVVQIVSIYFFFCWLCQNHAGSSCFCKFSYPLIHVILSCTFLVKKNNNNKKSSSLYSEMWQRCMTSKLLTCLTFTMSGLWPKNHIINNPAANKSTFSN